MSKKPLNVGSHPSYMGLVKQIQHHVDRKVTRYLPTHVFFIAAGTFLTGFSASSCVPDMVRPSLVASTLGDLLAAAIAIISVTSKQAQSLYIQ